VPRAGLLKAAVAGRITNAQGARALRLSVRQFRPQAAVPGAGGPRPAHALRGRPGNRRLAAAAREQISVLLTTTYADFNDVHLTEKLREVHHLVVRRSTVRHLRLALGRPPAGGQPRSIAVGVPANPRSANSPNSTPAPTRGSRTAAPWRRCRG
jgi:hypothetical protein